MTTSTTVSKVQGAEVSMFKQLASGEILTSAGTKNIDGDLDTFVVYKGFQICVHLSISGQQYLLSMGHDRFMDEYTEAGGEYDVIKSD